MSALQIVVTAVVALLTAALSSWASVARFGREAAAKREEAREAAEAKREEAREAAEARREEARARAAGAREEAMLAALTRGAEAQAQTSIILDAIRAHLEAHRRTEDRIAHTLSALAERRVPSDRPSAEAPPPPPIPDGRTVQEAGRRPAHPSIPSIPSVSLPMPPGREAIPPEPNRATT